MRTLNQDEVLRIAGGLDIALPLLGPLALSAINLNTIEMQQLLRPTVVLLPLPTVGSPGIATTGSTSSQLDTCNN